ncbi:MAG TPA: twin-arginine translocase TatA/TatE family subunit [Anaerolineales bacterium]|nr:twin-arginine translocase TatA/TatE family subunit [Anaerolineales bacterium]
MDLLGIGLPELTFLLILVLIIMGPKEMASTGKTIGRTLRKFIMSPEWKAMRKTGQEIQHLPNKLMREAMIEDLTKEVKDSVDQTISPVVEEIKSDLEMK